MNRQDRLYRLQLDHDALANEKIDSVTVIDRQIFVPNRDHHLPAHWQVLLFQLVKQTRFIRAFEQARPDNRMDLDRRTDDRMPDLFFSHPSRPLRALCVLCGEGFYSGRNSRTLASSWRGLKGLAI